MVRGDGLGGRQQTRRPLASEIDSHDEVYSDRAEAKRSEQA